MSWRICTRSMGLAECSTGRAAFSRVQASYQKLDESLRLCGQKPRLDLRIDSDGLAFPALKHLNQLATGDFFCDDFPRG